MDINALLYELRKWRRNYRKTYNLIKYKKESDRPNAYITLVMLGDNYIPGALVLAHSLRRTNTTAKIVCMCTNDLSTEGIDQLKQIYDDIIIIDYISETNINYGFTKNHSSYVKWVDKSFTKFNCIKLIQYKKICFLDADMIPIQNIDHLFNYSTFTGIYSSYADITNPNGGKIPFDIKAKFLSRHPMRGSIFILEPSLNDYNRIIDLLKYSYKFKNFNTKAGPDEFILSLYYWKKLRYLHRGYSITYGAEDKMKIPKSSVFVLNFIGTKPWECYKPEYPDFILFYNLYKEIKNKYLNIAELKYTKC